MTKIRIKCSCGAELEFEGDDVLCKRSCDRFMDDHKDCKEPTQYPYYPIWPTYPTDQLYPPVIYGSGCDSNVKHG